MYLITGPRSKHAPYHRPEANHGGRIVHERPCLPPKQPGAACGWDDQGSYFAKMKFTYEGNVFSLTSQQPISFVVSLSFLGHRFSVDFNGLYGRYCLVTFSYI